MGFAALNLTAAAATHVLRANVRHPI
jgi:hypothetical protein